MKRGTIIPLIIGVLLVGTAPQALGYGRGTFKGQVVDSGVQPEPRPSTKIKVKVKGKKIKVTTVDLVLYCGRAPGDAPGFEAVTATVGTAYGKLERGVPTFPSQRSFFLHRRVRTTTSVGPATIDLSIQGSVLRKKVVGTVDADTILHPPHSDLLICDDEANFTAKKKK